MHQPGGPIYGRSTNERGAEQSRLLAQDLFSSLSNHATINWQNVVQDMPPTAGGVKAQQAWVFAFLAG